MIEQAPAYREDELSDEVGPPDGGIGPSLVLVPPEGIPAFPHPILIESFADYEAAQQEEPQVFEAVYDDVDDKECLHSMVKYFASDPAVMMRVDRDFVDSRQRSQSKPAFTDNLLTDFKNRASRYRLLTAEEEVILARNLKLGVMAYKEIVEQNKWDNQILLGLAKEGAYSYQAFFHTNLRLVFNMVRNYQSAYQHIEESDGLTFAYIGLQRAIEKFDETRGFKFSTYATNWIRQAIRRGVTDEGRMVRLPEHKDAELKKFRKKKDQLANRLGREPTPEEIQAVTGVTDEDIKAFESFGDYSTTSLNKEIDDGGREFGDLIICEDPSERSAETIAAGEKLERLIEWTELTFQEKLILSLWSGVKLRELEGSTWKGMPYEEIFDSITPSEDKKRARVSPSKIAIAACMHAREVADCQAATLEKLQDAALCLSDSGL